MTTRRAIAERVIARAIARGAVIDADAEFIAIVELWVTGEIEADEMRSQYNALLDQRSRVKRSLASGAELTPEKPETMVVEANDQPPDEVMV